MYLGLCQITNRHREFDVPRDEAPRAEPGLFASLFVSLFAWLRRVFH